MEGYLYVNSLRPNTEAVTSLQKVCIQAKKGIILCRFTWKESLLIYKHEDGWDENSLICNVIHIQDWIESAFSLH